MFIINLTYIKPIEQVDEYLEEHILFLEDQYRQNKLIFSGRKTPRTGGIILSSMTDKDEVERTIQMDPFYKHRIAEYEIIQFEISKFDKRFEAFVVES